jgi:magnesium transporter
MALVIRALALDRLQAGNTKRLMHKELAISLLNGSVWGVLVGLFAMALYSVSPVSASTV